MTFKDDKKLTKIITSAQTNKHYKYLVRILAKCQLFDTECAVENLITNPFIPKEKPFHCKIFDITGDHTFLSPLNLLCNFCLLTSFFM